MAAMRVIPALDELEDCYACFDLGFEAAAVEQFAFERGRRRPLLPRVITTGGDAQYAAHRGRVMHGLVSPYELERRDGVEPVS